MKMKVLIDTLNHGGSMRSPGELIDVDEAGAAQLIQAGAAEIVPVAEKLPNPDDNSGGGDEDPDNKQSDSAAGANVPKTGKKESKPKTK